MDNSNELKAGGGTTSTRNNNYNKNATNNMPSKISKMNMYDDAESKKEKNNKIIIGMAVKPTDEKNSKGYLMNGFDIFTVYNSLPYSNLDNVDDFLKNFFKFIQTKRDKYGNIESYDNVEDVVKKDITYYVIDPHKYSNTNENLKYENGDNNQDKRINPFSDKRIRSINRGILSRGGKKTQRKSKKNRKTKKSQKSQKSIKRVKEQTL